MPDNEFIPTEQEIAFLKAKRQAEIDGKVDMSIIKAGMSLADKVRVAKKILELWRH